MDRDISAAVTSPQSQKQFMVGLATCGCTDLQVRASKLGRGKPTVNTTVMAPKAKAGAVEKTKKPRAKKE